MKLSSLIGLFLSVSIVAWSIVDATSNSEIFLNLHAAVMVVGGTLAATLIAFPVKTVIGMFKVVIVRVVGGKQADYSDLILEISTLATGYRKDKDHLKNQSEKIENHFLKESIELMLQGGLRPDQIDVILRKRAKTHYDRYLEEANTFRTISKLPPAFGLLGAVLGMIALMEGLGGPDAFKTIGPAMAVAMVATFYGIAFANFILIPFGENLAKSSREDMIARRMVIEGIKMIREREHPLVIEEELKSYLLPSERLHVQSAA